MPGRAGCSRRDATSLLLCNEKQARPHARAPGPPVSRPPSPSPASRRPGSRPRPAPWLPDSACRLRFSVPSAGAWTKAAQVVAGGEAQPASAEAHRVGHVGPLGRAETPALLHLSALRGPAPPVAPSLAVCTHRGQPVRPGYPGGIHTRSLHSWCVPGPAAASHVSYPRLADWPSTPLASPLTLTLSCLPPCWPEAAESGYPMLFLYQHPKGLAPM